MHASHCPLLLCNDRTVSLHGTSLTERHSCLIAGPAAGQWGAALDSLNVPHPIVSAIVLGRPRIAHCILLCFFPPSDSICPSACLPSCVVTLPGLQGGVFLNSETAPALFEYLSESQEDEGGYGGGAGGEQQLGRTARHLLKHSGLDEAGGSM